MQLESYLQSLCHDPGILHGATFNGFLLGSQLETGGDVVHDVEMDVFLMNHQRVEIRASNVLQTDEVLEVRKVVERRLLG